MSEVITLKQFDGSTVTPKDDAIMYDYFGGETGLLEGCDLTHTGAGQIRIGAGRGIIKGRQFVVQEHTINVTLSSDSDIPGRVYIRMDLSDTSEPVKILHVTAAVLPDLEQDENCNNDNGVYEIELGIYTASKLTISNLEKTISRISPKLAKNMVVDNPDDVGAVTEQGYPVGCRALNGLLGGIRFGVDNDGNYGYIKAGADTVTPFKKGGGTIKTIYYGIFNITNVTFISQQNEYSTYRINDTWSNFVGKYLIIACISTSGASQQNPGIIYNGIYEGKPFLVSVYGNNTGYPTRANIYAVNIEN